MSPTWPHDAPQMPLHTAVVGIDPRLRPTMLSLSPDQSIWDIAKAVWTTLNEAGMPRSAREFLCEVPYADQDTHMLITLALNYVRIDDGRPEKS